MKQKIKHACQTSISVMLILLMLFLVIWLVIMGIKNVKSWLHGIIDIELILCLVIGIIMIGVTALILNLILPENIDFDDPVGIEPIKYDPDKDHDKDE